MVNSKIYQTVLIGDSADLGDFISGYEIAEEHAAGDELNIELESDPAKDVRRILRSGPFLTRHKYDP